MNRTVASPVFLSPASHSNNNKAALTLYEIKLNKEENQNLLAKRESLEREVDKLQKEASHIKHEIKVEKRLRTRLTADEENKNLNKISEAEKAFESEKSAIIKERNQKRCGFINELKSQTGKMTELNQNIMTLVSQKNECIKKTMQSAHNEIAKVLKQCDEENESIALNKIEKSLETTLSLMQSTSLVETLPMKKRCTINESFSFEIYGSEVLQECEKKMKETECQPLVIESGIFVTDKYIIYEKAAKLISVQLIKMFENQTQLE